ncbi:MAG: acetyltransferase, family [Rhizobium sp.]|nr:acetyltransferase, family [Rhizobium sp.]
MQEDGGILSVVLSTPQTIGRVEWFTAYWGRRDTSACWTISASIFAPFRNQGYGTLAQRQLVAYLFDHTRMHRIQAYTDVENVMERRALEAAGFQLEGVIRGAQWRKGKWHDQALYSITRPE